MMTASQPTAEPAHYQAPWQDRDGLRITGVRAIATAPEGCALVVVRVDTNEPGLYGLGCASFTQVWSAVVTAVEDYVAPLAVGRHPADIEDLGAVTRYSSYWRQGPVLNNAISGLDMALWDIAGKRAGMPVYELFGGRARAAVPVYTHAAGRDVEEVLDRVSMFIERGYRSVRCQIAAPGRGHYGAPALASARGQAPYLDGWEPAAYVRLLPQMFTRIREAVGDEVALLHDVHSRLTPKEAIVLCRSLEQSRLGFVEDVVAPEHYDHLPQIRAASPVPIAVGELLVSVPEAARLVVGRGVDLLRLHVSSIGGVTPARKLMALCELTGVRTAWHGPADVSPVGVAANVALDVSSPAFGYQEGHDYPEHVKEIFPGCPEVRNGYLWPSSAPGWGIDLDETVASRYPPEGTSEFVTWAGGNRRDDGALQAP